MGLGNAITASNANKANLENLKKNDILEKEIPPHASITGIITIEGTNADALTFVFE